MQQQQFYTQAITSKSLTDIKKNVIAQAKIKTRIGTLYLVSSEKGLRGIFWNKQKAPLTQNQILSRAEIEIQEYLDGSRKNFNLPLDLEGTVFQKKVWKQLQKIPYGKTVSYQKIAKQIKNPKAVRAVGTANGKNPLCIIIPCHRVISADGSLGGYSGGVKIKKTLLALESISKTTRP